MAHIAKLFSGKAALSSTPYLLPLPLSPDSTPVLKEFTGEMLDLWYLALSSDSVKGHW